MPFRKKAREWKSRFKAEIESIFGNDEAPTDGQSASSASGTSSWVKSEGWTNLKALLDTINQGTTMSGLGPVKAVIEGLVGCIQIFEDEAQGRKEYKELRKQLEDIFNELRRYLSSSPAITTSVTSICGSIQKELEYVKAQQTRPRGKRLAEAEMDADNVLECYRRIHDHLQRLSRNANISTWIIVDQFTTDNRLKSLAPSLSACYNSKKAAELKRGPCTAGTRINVLAQMHQWTTSPDSGNIYWMSGMAGTGKTTIAYSLCEQLDAEPSRMLCASFFCSRSLPEYRDVGQIIPSIAFQLAQCSLPFRYALSQAIEKDPVAYTRSPRDQFDSLVVQPLSDAKVKEAIPTNMVAVIDALDECEDTKSTQQILEVLLTKSKGLPIKFVVSSRPEALIRHQMEKNGTWVESRVVLHELDTGEVQTDIKTYLKTELAVINPSNIEVETLAERAGVLFIYAATVIRYVGYDNFGRNPRGRLKSVLEMENQSRTQTEEIDELYRTILEGAISDKKLEEMEREDMKLILHTVICAKSPLTVDALNEFLQLGSQERVKAALRPLWSVLHVMGPKMTVTTLHASFPDYLTDHSRSGNSQWYCDTTAHHQLLAQRCFECIHDTRPQFNICQLPSSYLYDTEVEDLDARVEAAISTQLRYACLYWSVHLNACEPDATPILLTKLDRFLTKNLLLWLEVMNLMKDISSTRELLAVSRWATRHGATQELISLIQDAWRCAHTVVSGPISQSTPHIYISILPLLPSHSPIRKHYNKQMCGMIEVDGTALDRRKPLLARWELMRGNCAACSPDGTLVATAPQDSSGIISLIDVSSGRLVRNIFNQNYGTIWCLAFSPDGTRLVSGTSKKLIWVWDVSSGQRVLGPLSSHEGAISSIVYSHDGSRFISGSSDNTIVIWDVRLGKPAFEPLLGHNDTVRSISISSDDTWIVSGSRDCTVCVWNMQTGSPVLGPLKGHTSTVMSVAISPNDKLIVSGSLDSTVRVWCSQTGQMILGPLSHQEPVCSVAISPNSGHILAGLDGGTIRIWDATTGKAVPRTLEESSHRVNMLAHSSDGTRIISYSNYKGTLCLYNALIAIVAMESLPGHTKAINSIDISPDGEHIVSGSYDAALCIWDAFDGKLVLGPITGHTLPIHLVKYSSDNNRILSCSFDGTLRQWNAQTGESVQVPSLIISTSTPLSEYRPKFALATYSPDGTNIATISNSSDVCVWHSSSGKQALGPIQTGMKGMALDFTVDGTGLITGWSDGSVRIWNAQSSQLISSTQPQRDLDISALAFSSDHSHYVAADSLGHSFNLTVHPMNDVAEEQIPLSFTGHTWNITSVQFSRDGARIVSGSDDWTVQIWDPQSHQSLFGPLKGHTDEVRSVAYSPDGTYVASASDDKTIRIWNTNTQPEASPLIDWVLDQDGWVVDQESRRLIWLPPDLRNSLMSPRNTMLLSRDGSVGLNFAGALVGTQWMNCWQDG